MATPTSSSNRSTRKTKKPVTQGQDPQRSNRQKVSNANVTNSTQRTSNGTAKVTTGKGGPKPKALPPAGKSGGSQPPKGTSVPQRGGPTLTPQQQAQQRRATAAAKKAAAGVGTRSNTATPMPGSNPVSGVRRIGGGLVAGTALTAAAGKAIETLGRAANPNEWRRVQQELKDRGYGGRSPVNKDPNGRSSRGVNTSNGRTVATGSQQYNDYRNQQIADNRERLKGVGNPPAAKPKPPAPTQSGGSSTQSRGSSSAPAAPRRQPGPAADAGMKNQDPKFRGNLFEKTFGYKPGQAPDQQKARFKSVDNKFGQDSGYETKTKVDGSKYADKKPDMKKVKEYDRLRRKYYD